MEHYTVLNKAEIEDLLSAYKIDQLNSFKLLIGGSENTNYKIVTKTERYVLCICEQKSFSEATILANLLLHLERHQFKTSKLIRTNDQKLFTLWNDKPVILRSYISGRVPDQLTNLEMQLLGKELANLHQVGSDISLPTITNYGLEQFKKVKAYAKGSEFDRWLDDIKNYISPFFENDLPKSIIHSDLFADNLVIHEDGITIMDFEEAAYYYRVFDIGMTIIGTCSENEKIDANKAKHLLEGYIQIELLTELEIQSLKAFTIYAGASMTFWRYHNFNQVNPDPKMYHHYLKLKALVDYLLEQEDDYFSWPAKIL